MTAIRDPSGDQAGKVNCVSGPPSASDRAPGRVHRQKVAIRVDHGEPWDGGRREGSRRSRDGVRLDGDDPATRDEGQEDHRDHERKDDRDLDDPASATRGDRRIRVRSLELDGFVHPPTIRDLGGTVR